MTDNSFDKFIKEKMNNFSSPVPNGLWEKIANEKDKKPIGAAWWKNYGFAFIATVAVLFCATIFFNHDSTKDAPSSSRISNAETANNAQQQSSSSAKQSRATSANPIDDNLNTRSLQATDNIDKVSANKVNINDDKSSATTSFNKEASSANNAYKSSSIVQTTHNKKEELRVKSNSQQLALINKNLFKSGAYNSQNIIHQNIQEDNTTSFLTKPVSLSTSAIDKNLTKLFANDHIIKSLKDFKLMGMDNCPSARGPVRNDFYIEIYGSPDYAKKTINNAGAANSAFLQRKDSTEKMRLSYTAGFRLTKTIGENMLIKAGLQYSQINEKFNYRSENERKLTTVITIRTVIRSAGDTAIVRDTSTVEQIGYRVKTTYNRYKSIDVPLLVGFEWGNDNLKAAATGGVILNLYSWQKGESLDTSYVPVAFNKGTGSAFKQNIGLGLYAGFSLLKKVNDNAEFFMEPYFRYNLSNMTNNKSLFNQKFQVAGINMGIRYKLNKGRQR